MFVKMISFGWWVMVVQFVVERKRFERGNMDGVSSFPSMFLESAMV